MEFGSAEWYAQVAQRARDILREEHRVAADGPSVNTAIGADLDWMASAYALTRFFGEGDAALRERLKQVMSESAPSWN